MAKTKKKLTTAQKRAKKDAKARRQEKYMRVFMNGKLNHYTHLLTMKFAIINNQKVQATPKAQGVCQY